MATPRSQIVDPSVTPWHHSISRCVRRAFLCGGEFAHRKRWIVERLEELVGIFAVDCAGFAIMDCDCRLIDRASRLAREGKAQMHESLPPIFDRLRSDALAWGTTVSRLLSGALPSGSHFGSASCLTAAARAHGRRWPRNQLPRVRIAASAAA